VDVATLEKLLAVVAVLGALALGLAVRERLGRTRAERAREETERTGNELERRIDELAENRAAMETVLSSMRDGVILVSSVGGVRLVNEAAERLLGGRPATLAGIRPTELQRIVWSTSTESRPQQVDVESGVPTRSLHAEAVPVADGSVLLIMRDVTEAARLERMRRDLVANASHELKTPAASIQAAAETIGIAVTDDPEAVPRFARQLERDAARLSRIVSDLLDLSRLEGGSELRDAVSLAEVIAEDLERFATVARDTGVVLETSCAPNVPPVRGSRRDLALMVENLVDNAIRYTKEGGRVEILLAGSPPAVVFTVRDTGIGIPTRELPRVFERFYRVDRARSRDTGGTGLGLSIVRHVVENHGGSVEVESELGRGSTFTVRLPAAG
jgi:signal transduction histidine kinase